MRRDVVVVALALGLALASAQAQQPTGPTAAPSPAGRAAGRGGSPPYAATDQALAAIAAKSAAIEAIVTRLKSQRVDPALIGDVEVYAKAGRFLVEFPDLVNSQAAMDRADGVLDAGLLRAQQLQSGQSPWTSGASRVYAYYSEIDGSVQPYHVTLPATYDPERPARLYVWLHGRQNNTTETEFIASFDRPRPPGNAPVADHGQIQLDLFGRLNSAGWHWAGEADVFEAIAAVKKRFRIDPARVLLRGFSMGGEGAWHIGLHHPDRFAAAEIGAGTWSRRSQTPDLEPYQYAALKIWENMEEWALNAFNLPVAAHGGDMDNQIASLPGPLPGTPTRGQLEASLRMRAQLEKEGFVAEGDPDFLRMKGTPSIFLISQNTGHSTSPLVRQRLDAFLEEWGDKGQSSPDHIRFVTYTSRYERNYWISVESLGTLYERADVDARREDGRSLYAVSTTNVARLALREMDRATTITIDGQKLTVKGAPTITLQKTGDTWKVSPNGPLPGLHKRHALQGPIDDAFLEPFLLVRPTGTPWNDAVHQQTLRSLARFDRLWARYFRGHPFVKDDRDVTEADFAKYHVVLFGDPGSNQWIARLVNRLPLTWTRDTLRMGADSYPAATTFPALVYPNPLRPSKYVVLNTGLTIADRDYNGDYGMPRWGDYALVKVNASADVPDLVTAGLFDNNWQLAKP